MKKIIRAKLFNIETLEPRILLSADPIVGELVQQYYNANAENLGAMQVAEPTATEKVVLKQSSQENAPPNTLNLDLADLKNQNYPLNSIEIQNFADFQNAAGQIVVGNEQSNAIIHIGDANTPDGVVPFNSNVLISNPQNGGEIFIDDDLIGGANADLTIHGSGHTTTLSADISTATGSNISINDSLKISGSRTIDSGASIQIGSASNHFLDGNSASGNSLTLKAFPNTGNVVVKGVVGGDVTNKLGDLTITGNTGSTGNTKVNDVTFDSAVTINGDVIIYASGTVTFGDTLSITGNLTINGAKSVVFGNRVTVSGTTGITLTGGSGLTDSVSFSNDVTSSKSITIDKFETVAFNNNLTLNAGDLTITNAKSTTFDNNVVVSAGVISLTDTLTTATDSVTFNSNVTTSSNVSISNIETVVFKTALNITSTGDLSITNAKSTSFGNNVVISSGALSVIDSLTTSGDNLTFNGDVTTSGNVSISAIDTVVFNTALSVTNGTLTISGAKLAVFENNVVVGSSKDISLEADEITLNGGQESVRGTGKLTLFPTTKTYDIAVASPPAENTDNTLNISSSELVTLKTGFSAITIGRGTTHADATATGTVYIGSKASNQNTFTDSVTIFANNIVVKDYSDSNLKFQTKNDITLDAVVDITIANEVKAIDSATNKNITLYSATGSIKQNQDSSNDSDGLATESIIGGALAIRAATGIDLGWVNVVSASAVNTSTGGIKVNSNAPTSVTTTFTSVSVTDQSQAITLSSESNPLVISTNLTTTSGAIKVNAGTVASSTLIINNPILTTTTGSIDLKSSGDLTLNNTVGTTGSSSIAIESTAGKVTQNAFAITSTGGSISVKAKNDLTTNAIIQTLGASPITLLSSAGKITQNANISSAGGNISMTASGDLTIGASATVATTVTGTIAILSTAGNIVQNSTVTTAAGSITIKANKDLTIGAIVSVTGSTAVTIALEATTGKIAQNANITSTLAGNLITLTAGTSIEMLDGKSISTGAVAGTITLVAGTDVKLSILEAVTAINVTATAGAITDNLTGETENLRGATTAVKLVAKNGIGASSNDINTKIANLNVSNTLGSGGIFITETDALIITTGGIISSGSDGSVVIVSGANLTANADVNVSGSTGNVLLKNTTGNITLNGFVKSANGNISIISSLGSIIHTALGDIEVSTDDLKNTTKTIELEAALAITMVDGTTIKTQGGNVRLNAKGGDIQIGAIDAKTGSVSLLTTTGFSILDVEGADGDTDIIAANLRLNTKAVGTMSNQLDVNATNLSVTTVNGLFISEVDGVVVKEIPIVNVNRIGANATMASLTLTSPENAAQSGLKSTSDGAIVLTTVAGDITLDNPVTSSGNGNVLINAKGALKVNTILTGGTGSINLISGATFTQTDHGYISTTDTGTINVSAETAIIMANAAETRTINKDIRYKTTTGDITLGSIDAGTGGSVAVIATAGNILDAESVSATPALDVKAKAVNLVAGIGVATGENPLEISVDNLSGKAAAGGIFVAETDSISVDGVSLTVNAVSTAGTVTTETAMTTDLITSANGAIVLNAKDITLKEGGDNNGRTVGALDSGNILFNASAGNISIQSGVVSNTGNISFIASGDINESASGFISAGSNNTTIGTIDLNASGAVTMADGARIRTSNGSIRLNASNGDVTVGAINADSGGVSLSSGARILDANNNDNDITAGRLRMNSAISIGTSDNAIDISVTTLSATVGGGGIFLSEANGVTVTTVDTISVNRVDTKAAVSMVTDVAQSDLISAGSIVLTTLSGDITILDGNDDGKAIVGNPTGNILLNAWGGMSVQADINANGGNITLFSRTSIVQGSDGNIITEAKGTIDLRAAIAINMEAGAKIQTAGGNVRLNAVESLTLSSIDAAKGGVSLMTSNIVDYSGDKASGVVASNLRINAVGVGTGSNKLDINVDNLSASVTTGGLFINEANDVTVAETPAISVNRVATTGLVSDVVDTKQSNLTSTTGAIVVTTQAGGITILDGNTDEKGISTQSGNILLNAAANLNIQTTVENLAGSLSLISGATLTQTATGNLTTGGSGTIDVSAATSIVMADGAVTKTANKDIRYKTTTGNITVSSVNAGTANIALLAGGSIFDANTTAVDITAAGVNFVANVAIGLSGNDVNPLEITASKLTARAGAGGIFITDTDAANVDQVSVTVQQVKSTGVSVTDKTLTASDLMTTDGAIILNAPKITINDGDTNNQGVMSSGSGNILLNASAGDLELQTSVSSGSGHLSLLSSAAIKQNVAGHIITGKNGTIQLDAGADITMINDAKIQATNGNVRLNTVSNILVGSIATGGNVSLIADKILDNGSHHTIAANALRINAGSVGLDKNTIDTDINELSAVISTGGLFITEANALTITEISALTVNRVALDASLSAVTDAKQSGVMTESGAIILTTLVGDMTISDGTGISTQSGNILLNAAGNMSIQNRIESLAGNMSLISGATVTQTAKGVLSVGGLGTINVSADTAIMMSDGAIAKTSNKDIRFKTTTGDITLGDLDVGNANIAVLAGGSIIDADTTTVADIVAKGLNLTSRNGIATGENPLETSVGAFTAKAGAGGLFMTEANAIVIDQVSVSVNLVSTAGISSADTKVVASDLSSFANGSIVLTASDIILNDGDNNHKSVEVSGAGNILLTADAGNLSVLSNINSGSGNISLSTSQDLNQASLGNIITGGLGTIDLLANGLITMANGVKTQTANGNIRLNAISSDLTIGQINAGTGSVSLISGGRILDGNDSGNDVTAGALRLNSLTDVGSTDNALDINVMTLSAMIAGNNGLFISDADGIVVTLIDPISVNRIDAKAAVSAVIDEAQSDLISTANGSIVLTTLSGDITILDGNADGKGIVGNPTGNILLNASGGVSVQADINANGGNLTLFSNASIVQGADGNIITEAKGTIDLTAAKAINMETGAKIQTAGGNVRLNAVSLTLSSIDAAKGGVSLIAKNIVDLSGNNPSAVVASNLRINAVGVGTGTNKLDINVDNLSASVTTDGLFINEANDVTVTEIPDISINRVATTGSVSDIVDTKQSNLTGTTGAIVVSTQAGGITVLDGDTDKKGITTQSGNILLNATVGSITLQTEVSSIEGAISLISTGTITQGETGNITTDKGSLDLSATNISSESTLQTISGNIRLHAINMLSLNQVDAGTGSVSLIAAHIFDSGLARADVIATNLSMKAKTIGTNANALNIDVDKLSASATKGLFINENNDIAITEVPTITVKRVTANGSLTELSDKKQSGLKSVDGAIMLTALNNITLTAADKGGKSIDVTGKGNVLIKTSSGSITIDAEVNSGTGNLSVLAKQDITQTDAGRLISKKTIDVSANQVIMRDGATIDSKDNIIRIYAKKNLQLSGVNAGNGSISLVANKIIDAGDSSVDLTAKNLRINASGAGTFLNPLEANVDSINATTGKSGLFITRLNDLTTPTNNTSRLKHIVESLNFDSSYPYQTQKESFYLWAENVSI